MNNTKKLKATILTLLLLAIFVSIISYSAAYFLAELDRTGTHSMVVELIFDRLTVSNGTAIPSGSGTTTAFDPEAEWGTAQNPYVISQKHHVQNLSALQNSGFFADRVDNDGKPIQSYFLVSDTAGKPVVIDCGGMRLSPVGSADNPFTGHINGVVGTTTATYNNYGVSVSTISNLKIEAKEDTPDIGFFGYVGYNGTKTTGKDDVLAAGSFISCVEDLLFADVEVTSQKSLLEILEDWWKGLNGDHDHTSDRAETHHVGIIAGHAEFAILRNLSVYYTEEVPAFTLNSNASGSKTNYYSVTGLIGTLKYVNPTVNSDGTISGSAGVSDSNIFAEGGGGGGGDQTGTMTGYMMAKNIFDMHEKYLNNPTLNTENKPIKDEYDVKEMKKADGSELFSSVEMTEKEISEVFGPGTKKTYYYFRDKIFTFAMSVSQEDTAGADYVSKIWDLKNTPEIYGVREKEKFKLEADSSGTQMYAYKLTKVKSLEGGKNYVAAYVDNGGDTDASNDKIYFIDFYADDWQAGFQREISLAAINTDANGNPIITYTTTENDKNIGIESMEVIGTDNTCYNYAFKYVSSGNNRIQSPFSEYSGKQFGIHFIATGEGNEPLDRYEINDVAFNSNTHNANGYSGGENRYACNWTFSSKGNGKFAIHNAATMWGGNATYFWAKFMFQKDSGGNDKIILDNDVKSYEYDGKDSANITGDLNTTDTSCHFTMLEVDITPIDLTPKKVTVDDADKAFAFDPSTHVITYKRDNAGKIVMDGTKPALELKPLSALGFNDGNGRLLKQLNHIVKLFKATEQNEQYTIFNGDPANHPEDNINTGGVIYAPIGSEGKAYTIPTGMIAFYVKDETISTSNPSYVDIIVSTNPGSKGNGSVGIWKAADFTKWETVSFQLDNPLDSFDLPPAKFAVTLDDVNNDAIKLAGGFTVSGSGGTTTSSDTTYIYPAEERVFIHHRFELTEEGIYFFGSRLGELSISYFSVTGAAGAGSDGTDDGTVIGNIDFVYDNGTDIMTVNKKFSGNSGGTEDHNNYYYPSYYYMEMLPESGKQINKESVWIRRVIDSGSRKLIFTKPPDGKTEMRGLSMYQDELESNEP